MALQTVADAEAKLNVELAMNAYADARNAWKEAEPKSSGQKMPEVEALLKLGHELSQFAQRFAAADDAGRASLQAEGGRLRQVKLAQDASHRRKSQAKSIRADLIAIDVAVDRYALAESKASGAAVSVADWQKHLPPDSRLRVAPADVLGNEFGPQVVDTYPAVPPASKQELVDVADEAFWTPFR